MRKFLVWFFSVTYLMAVDATLHVDKAPTILPTISIEDGSINYTKYISKKFHKILRSDLHVLSQFDVKDHYSKNDFPTDGVHKSNAKVKYVVRYRLRQNNDGLMLCDFKLIDTDKEESLFERTYRITKQDLYVFLAHEIAVEVNNYFKLPSINWMTKRVIFARYISPRNTEIVISDYSLNYQKVIIRKGLNIFPKWADAKQRSFYYTVVGQRPTLYKYNILTGEHTRITTSEGMLTCSDVSKNFDKLLLTMAPDGQPDVYLYDLKSGDKERLTHYNGIDVSGQFLDDEKRIAFVSERLGRPNIFAQTMGEKAVEQLVFYGKNNNSCSTFRNYIVYTSRETNNAFSQNAYNLHLISTQTEYVRHLTATGVNQFPKFSDDGDAIIFIKHFKRQSALGIIRLKENKSFLFPLKVGKIQSLDW
jgi:TolB protein